MTLLEEIQNSAVDPESVLGTLLRKCKVLAARLGSQPLEDWLLWESNGYPESADVPDYRIWTMEVRGHFWGYFGSGLRNAPVSMAHIPDEIRDALLRYKCRQSIASIEAVLSRRDSSKAGVFRVNTGNLALMLGMNVYQDQNCLEAWAECSESNLIELLNAVRNRILDFTLAVWKEAPSAGEQAERPDQKIEPGRVTQIFNTTVYGGAANIVGSAINSSLTFTVLQDDFTSLEHVLRDNGVQDEDIDALQAAIQEDGGLEKETGFGSRVSSWIVEMTRKAANGSWAIGLGAAGNLLAQAISKYYGL